jgi:putative oxidoreductase
MALPGRSDHHPRAADLRFAEASRREMTMSPLLHAIGRALLPILFIVTGVGKFMNIPGTAAYIGPNRFPVVPQIESALGMNTPTILAWLTAGVETFGGLLVLIGLFTRSAATLLFLLCAATIFYFHNFWDIADAAQMAAQRTQALKNLSIMGGLLLLMANGAGPYSVDGRGGRA